MIKQRYLYFGVEEQVFTMFTTLDGFWDNTAVIDLPKIRSFFFKFLNSFTSINEEVSSLSLWLKSIRCAILSEKFNLSQNNYNAWFKLFFKFFEPYLKSKI
jgi:hypothetical protein